MSSSNTLLAAAIDFGTTSSGYAFSFKHDYHSDPLRISCSSWAAGTAGLISLKAPTTVLLDPEKKFHPFGFEAEDKYSELVEENQHIDWMYFRRFKMILHDNLELKRDYTVVDDRGRQMPALTIFSMAIRYLKDQLLEKLNILTTKLNDTATGIEMEDIHWLLTIPAIWDDSAKQLMRKVAEEII